MFSLVYGFYEYLFRKEEIRVLMLGLDKSGKTTMLERLKGLFGEGPGLDSHNILPTVGLNVGRLEAFKAQLIIWDLGGQPGLRSIWDKYYGDSHGLLFVVDATDPERFDEAKDALERALSSRDLFGAPLLVVTNKQDADNSRPTAEITQRLGLGKMDTRPCRVQPACAYTGEGMREGLGWLLDEIRRSGRASLLRQRAISA